MSQISTAYDDLKERLETLFPTPTYRELVNPRILEQNDTFALNRGWGLIVGPGLNQGTSLNDVVRFEREISVVQTIIHRGTTRDVSIIETAEKNLLEDQFTLINSFVYTNFDPIHNIDYVSDTGMEFIFVDQTNFISITTNFSIKYEEQCS